MTDFVGHHHAEYGGKVAKVGAFQIQGTVKEDRSDRTELSADDGVAKAVAGDWSAFCHLFADDAQLQVARGDGQEARGIARGVGVGGAIGPGQSDASQGENLVRHGFRPDQSSGRHAGVVIQADSDLIGAMFQAGSV